MTMYILAGSAFNKINSATVITPTSENALYPRSRLWDGRPSRSFRFNAVGNNVTLDFDFQGVLNGGFENDVLNWVDADLGTGVSTFTSSGPLIGIGSLLLTCNTAGSGNAARRYQDVIVGPGQYRVNGSVLGTGTSPCVGQVQDLTTGQFLSPSGTWTNANNQFAVSSVGTVNASVTFTVAAQTTLRISASMSITGGGGPLSGKADGFSLTPSIDFFSLHGHNMPAGGELTILVKSSDTDPTFVTGTTTRATINLDGQQTIYSKFGSLVSERYWRVQFGAGGSAQATTIPIEIGELVFGQSLTPLTEMRIGYEFKHMENHITSETRSGEDYVYPLLRSPRRVLTMQFLHDSQASFDEALAIFKRARGSANPLVIVPDSARPEVIYGRIGDEWSVRRITTNIYDENTVVVTESPLLAT